MLPKHQGLSSDPAATEEVGDGCVHPHRWNAGHTHRELPGLAKDSKLQAQQGTLSQENRGGAVLLDMKGLYFFLKTIFFFLGMSLDLPVSMCLQYPRRPGEGIRSHGVTDVCELPCGCPYQSWSPSAAISAAPKCKGFNDVCVVWSHFSRKTVTKRPDARTSLWVCPKT